MSGYVKAYRSRFDNPVLNRKPWCRLTAWDWLVSEAAWKPGTLHVEGKPLTVERGDVTHSLRFMAGKWGWSVKAVRTFLATLEKHEMLEKVENSGTKAGTKQTHLRICNYDIYQDNGHSRGTAGAQQGHKVEEGKKVRSKEEANASSTKKPRGSRLPENWVLPKEWGEWALDEGWPEQAIREAADEFRDYWISLSGAKATKLDWQATWRNWMRKRAKLKTPKGRSNGRDAAAEIARAASAGTWDAHGNDGPEVRPLRVGPDGNADPHGPAFGLDERAPKLSVV